MRWLIWAVVVLAAAGPAVLSLTSPLLSYRQPVYILAGFAGILAFGLLLVQPMLVSGRLPVSAVSSRLTHRRVGVVLFLLVIVHVAALWVTSPPDVADALLLRSPTAFSLWGVIAMWSVFASALAALLRHRLGPRLWRRGHRLLVAVITGSTIVHALQIDGTMNPASKIALSLLVLTAVAVALWPGTRPWRVGPR